MGGTYSTDILGNLYDQGTPERVKYLQEAGNKLLAQISGKNMSLQEEQHIHFFNFLRPLFQG